MQGSPHLFRRIRVKLDQATRDGDKVLYILTNLPLRKASAKRVAGYIASAGPGDGIPASRKVLLFGNQYGGVSQAALFGFCLALVAYNMLAVVMAALQRAWRRGH